jgi:hypothetical protein
LLLKHLLLKASAVAVPVLLVVIPEGDLLLSLPLPALCLAIQRTLAAVDHH